MRCPDTEHSMRTAIPATKDLFGAMFGWMSVPDAAGLSRARRRVTEAETAALHDRILNWSLASAAPNGRLVPGMPVIAVDGSTLHVPRSRSLCKAFPISTDGIGIEQHHYPQAHLVSAWDVERRIPLSWRVTSKRVGERDALLDQLEELPERSVLLMDRGYPAREVLGAIVASGRHVVMRMVSTEAAAWREVADFIASGAHSAIVPVRIRHGKTTRTMDMRLVLRAFDRGRPHRGETRQTMVVLSTITDRSLISDDGIIDLYHQRWGIETIHRELKSLAAIERWHGTTKRLINQEITAVMSWFAIAGAIASRMESDALEAQRTNHDDGETKRVNSVHLFAAVHRVLIWQCAINIHHPAVVEYLRAQAEGSIDMVRTGMQRRRPGRWHERKPKHPYARAI